MFGISIKLLSEKVPQLHLFVFYNISRNKMCT